MSAAFEQTMKAMASKLSALNVPMCVKVTIEGTSAYLDATTGTWVSNRGPGLRVDAMLEGSFETFAKTLSGVMPVRQALETRALTFAGDLSLMPLVERAISGGPAKSEPQRVLEYVPRSR